jgi:ABC-type polysaccharide/polyol phosphate export permease
MTKSDALERNLGGENLLWSQPPKPIAAFRGSTIFTLVFGIFLTCMVIWISNQSSKNGSHSPAFFGYFMVAFGIFLILASLSDFFRAIFSIMELPTSDC